MRVLILANNDVGLFKFRKELIEELIHPGAVINGCKSPPCKVYISVPTGEYCSILRQMGATTIDSPIDRRGMNPIKDLRLLNHYRKIIKKVKPDIVLTYTIKPNVYGGIICGLKRIKYIANITGLGTSIEKGGIISKGILLIYRVGLAKAKIVFFQNKRDRLFFKQRKVVKKGIVLPGSGVNLDENKYEEYPENNGTLRFLFVGRIMQDKGISEFLECATYIKKKYEFSNFDILGDFDEVVFRDRIEKLQRKGIITYHGQQDDVHSFMKTHHAIILPTYHEGLSNVLLEAAATGRPVLASSIPGCQEVFDDGISGLGFEPRNTKALIDCVEHFISLPYEKKVQMGNDARQKVSKEFDRKVIIKAYLNAMEIQ